MMQLHRVEYGTAVSGRPPLIILHGLFGSSRNWHPIAKSLSKNHHIYTLDLRNHGQSPHANSMTYPDMAADVQTFIQEIGFDSVNLIGHSMGGKVAMWLALSQPELVNKLVVVDIAPVTYEHEFSTVLSGLNSIPLDTINSRQEADNYLAQFLTQTHLRQFLLQNLNYKDNAYSWRINLPVIGQSINDIIGFPVTSTSSSFPKRVMFIGGTESDYLDKTYHSQTRQLFPKATFSMVKAVGHWLHSEQPELFKALIAPYLN